ncbi:broad-complex core protein isoform X1 [Drosophila eugracilis]|uniref:broad-complex core protein isoform X1 n=1 Tax=Drosophila eugracilis TaxID=29029 RepID=UPI0007E8B299|nr:broad-complex core protein isoform X1 [Drosophila eugracilis]
MDDEFKLCWKNFQDNIASGFQNLYDRGDLVDVTLACDGKLLHAHKIVLAICSPYFQEIFTTNPCKHPIIILKDVSFNIMMELLEFMYQGVVNVKHTELQSFMKIGQLLQIKGLATNSNSSPGSSASEKSSSQTPAEESNNTNSTNHHNSSSNSNNNSKTEVDHNDSKGPSNSRTTSPGGASRASNEANHVYTSTKRPMPSDFGSDSLSIYSGKQLRRSLKDHGSGGSEGGGGENTDSAAGLENSLNSEEFFLPPIPHISMGEPRYDLGGLKRESDGHHHGSTTVGSGVNSGSVGSHTSSASPSAPIRNPFATSFNLDYNLYKGANSSGPSGSSNSSVGPGGINNNGSMGLASGTEYPNELYMPNDYSKNFANHMDIPQSGSNMVMLSTTSLLHGNCVFNRNNTVATQQGMKTYWLCKSYRISMCRARCITHLGRIISATGVHNHTPHMRGGQGSSASSTSSVSGTSSAPISSQAGYSLSDGGVHLGVDLQHGNRVSNMFANQTPPPPPPPPPLPVTSTPHHPHHHHHLGQHLPNLLVQHHPAPPQMEQHGSSANLMHNPNLMHLQTQTHHQQHHQQHSPHNPPPPQQHNLEIGGGSASGSVLLSPAHLQQSPQSNRSSHSLHAQSPPPQPVEEQQPLQQQQEGAAPEGTTDPSTAHVINSITISPSSRHTFKMENM